MSTRKQLIEEAEARYERLSSEYVTICEQLSDLLTRHILAFQGMKDAWKRLRKLRAREENDDKRGTKAGAEE